MKRILITVAAFAIALVTGCKSIPTTDEMHGVSKSIGVAAGIIADMTKIDDVSRNAVVEIMQKVVVCVPETNQTFEAAWTPIAQAHVAVLIQEGKLTTEQSILVMSAFDLAVKGLDYLFNVRFPKAREYKDLTAAAIDGFTEGFLAVFKPANATVANAAGVGEFDEAAYRYLKR